MHRRLDKLGAAAAKAAATKVRRELERRFQSQLADQAAAIRKRAVAEAQASSRRKLASMERKLNRVKTASQRAVERAVREAHASSHSQLASLQRKLDAAESAAQRAAKKAAKRAAIETAKMSRKELDLLKERAAKERAQHAADTARLKAKVDELSIRLDRQTSEQMGDMTEADALAALRRAFPYDDIQRIDRGLRGADILHKVIVDEAEVGRIVYECKNASSWQNEWLTKARGYRTEYQTQWVVIASRCFPRREKWFVVERGVPVIELRLIVRLAEVIRSAVIEIGSLRLTTFGRQAKAEQMFEYVLSDHFASRVKSIAEAVTALRAQQDRERQWHTETWAKNLRLYDEVDGGRRDIAAQVKAIAETPAKGGLRVIAGDR
jgi:hypothetical protein